MLGSTSNTLEQTNGELGKVKLHSLTNIPPSVPAESDSFFPVEPDGLDFCWSFEVSVLLKRTPVKVWLQRMQDPGGCWQTEPWDTLVRLRAQLALLTWVTVLDGVSSLHQKSYEQTKMTLQSLVSAGKPACKFRDAQPGSCWVRDLDTATEAGAACNRFFKLLNDGNPMWTSE